jgi:hypothetical protein
MASEDDPKIRAVAAIPKTQVPTGPPRTAPQQRGVARVSETREVTSRIYPSGAEPPPVFVDDSGKRGRLLTWLSLVFAVLALGLIAALWVSQAASTGG